MSQILNTQDVHLFFSFDKIDADNNNNKSFSQNGCLTKCYVDFIYKPSQINIVQCTIVHSKNVYKVNFQCDKLICVRVE